jgi:hypothetical protein
MKLLWIIFLLLAELMPAVALAQSDEFIVNPDGYRIKQRPGVLFPHSKHTSDLECAACHHAIENGRKSTNVDDLSADNSDIRCVACHATGKAEPSLMQAFHHQCLGCHRDTAKGGRPSGPQACGVCHVKNRGDRNTP